MHQLLSTGGLLSILLLFFLPLVITFFIGVYKDHKDKTALLKQPTSEKRIIHNFQIIKKVRQVI